MTYPENIQRGPDKAMPERSAPGGSGRPPAADAWSEPSRQAVSPTLFQKSRAPDSVIKEKGKKEILRARAKALASEPPATHSGDSIEVVEFQLADERYAIESLHVREVYPLKDLTPVPCTPDFVVGIINVRGEVIAVIDLRKFFELPISGITDLNKVIILQSAEMQIGILADSISGIRSLVRSQLQSGLPTLIGVRASYLRGLTDDRVIVLDTERLLVDQRILVHQDVEA